MDIRNSSELDHSDPLMDTKDAEKPVSSDQHVRWSADAFTSPGDVSHSHPVRSESPDPSWFAY